VKLILIIFVGVVLTLAAIALTIPATRTATRLATLPFARKDVYRVVTDIEDPSWRPTVRSAQVLESEPGKEKWIEVSNQGHTLTFRTLRRVEPSWFEIEFEGEPAIRGRWSGRFTEQSPNSTMVEFSETVTADTIMAKILGYLFFDPGEAIDNYLRDLETQLEKDGKETSN
jgi:hypothetical protein